MILSSVGARGHCGRPESWRVMGCVVRGPPHSSEPPTLVHSSRDCCWASRFPSLASTRVVTSCGNGPRTVNSQALDASNHKHHGRAKDPPLRPHRASLDRFPARRWAMWPRLDASYKSSGGMGRSGDRVFEQLSDVSRQVSASAGARFSQACFRARPGRLSLPAPAGRTTQCARAEGGRPAPRRGPGRHRRCRGAGSAARTEPPATRPSHPSPP
ncbi:hypothetical protein BJQ90_00037 [Arthrobacter sp. SO3]|nr:hypothetical protein [Arthrobacter sp. SO3]